MMQGQQWLPLNLPSVAVVLECGDGPRRLRSLVSLVFTTHLQFMPPSWDMVSDVRECSRHDIQLHSKDFFFDDFSAVASPFQLYRFGPRGCH